MEPPSSSAHALVGAHLHHHNILNFTRTCIALVAGYLSAAAACILALAALYGTIKLIYQLLTHRAYLSKGLPSFTCLRLEIGSAVALALQMLVAADVMETLTQVLNLLLRSGSGVMHQQPAL
jgi:uncharacterized membrane protein